ncbi:protein BASIC PENTACYSTEINE2-like [Ipomoea triloba]|uniref:protein BASIC PENTACYSTEINE2-like n=1 Tax=Ipomoea triloba TaxID=35885 RepID=UPI00125E382C|nr:protein BASIC PENTACYSTEINE2-like [Ipomoea triloba]XP_031091466.1 protein BASIC PENTACYSTEINE2-like [Ipomoea triloba]
MDGHGNLNLKNWGFFDPTATALKSHLGLQLMPTIAEKPLFGGGGGGRDRHHHYQPHHPHLSAVMASTSPGLYQHHRVGGISESAMPVEYMRDAWFNHSREKCLNVLSGNQHHHQPGYGVLPETSSAQSIHTLQHTNLLKTETPSSQMEVVCEEKVGSALVKKREGDKSQVQKSPKAKKAKRGPRMPIDECTSTPSISRARAPKRSAEVVINGMSMDISGIPVPVCSCTGNPQQCYRWGSGGWQSACCTTNLSSYPLPMSTKRRGARIAGRKMSLGAFKKVLEKLASEGYNFSNPIDLKPYWAKHGTNKFVTIR